MKSAKKFKILNQNSNTKLNTIEVEPSKKFNNKFFQKLFDKNISTNSSKIRLNSHENFHSPNKSNLSPEANKYSHKIIHKNRHPSNTKNSSKKKRKMKLSNSKYENNTFNNTNSISTRLIKSNKTSRVNYINKHSSTKKIRNYPNLIKGVLQQIKYYNLNKNTNYNDYMRYKPIDDFFNERLHSPIVIGNLIDNNTNSPTNSFKLDFNQEQKNSDRINNNENNIKKIKINEDEDLEKEIRPNSIIYRKKNIDNNIKQIKNTLIISPIKARRNSDKIDNDIINEDTYNNNFNGNIKSNTNDIIDSDNNILYFRSKLIPSDNINPIYIDKEEYKPKFKLEKENIYFSIYNNIINYKKKIFKNLNRCNNLNFNINNNKTKENTFKNLITVNNNKINYAGKKLKNKNKGPNYDDNGNLVFNNDNEVLQYIKKKIREEKDKEYNNNKLKYNYFILSKLFHGKLLYEIGLENNLNNINEILEKENVEVEHEPIMFIFKKDLLKIKNSQIGDEYNISDIKEIEKLKIQNEKLFNEKQNLITKIDLINKINNELENVSKKNENEFNKLSKKNIENENEINKMKKIINDYEANFEKYFEIINNLQIEKEKYTKYIIDLQEYNQKIIIEYQKIQNQLEIELQKNNNIKEGKSIFNNENLNVISVEELELINTNEKSENDLNNKTSLDNYNEDINITNNIEIIEDNDKNYDNISEQKFDNNEIIKNNNFPEDSSLCDIKINVDNIKDEKLEKISNDSKENLNNKNEKNNSFQSYDS